MNSVSPHPAPPFSTCLMKQKAIFIKSVFQALKDEGFQGGPSCPSKCDKILPSVWYVFFEHKNPTFFVKRGFWKEEGETFFFFFKRTPFNVLQTEDCVYCAYRGVMTLSESRFCSLRRYSANTSLISSVRTTERTETSRRTAKRSDVHVPVWLLLSCEDWSPAVDKGPQCSPRPQPPTRAVWHGYLLLTHNWKLTFF